MGFFDDYGLDADDFNENVSFDVPDGNYTFEITKAYIKEGTQNDEDKNGIAITYSLENEDGEAYTNTQYFWLPKDPDAPTQQEQRNMGEFKKFMLKAGIPREELNSAGPDELEGLTGTLELKTRTGKGGKEFQNTSNHVFDGVDLDDTPAPAPARTTRTAAKKPAAAKPASKPAAAAKKPAAAKGGKPNPFAK